MADVNKAIEFMLRQEDSKLTGKVTNAENDRGGRTRFGLCAKWHPALENAGFFDPLLVSDEDALALAKQTYAKEYARELRLADLRSDAVACAMLSFAVNCGICTTLRFLRVALNGLGANLRVTAAPEEDATFQAENACPEQRLVAAMVDLEKTHYHAIAAHDASQAIYLHGWLNRADQVLALVKG
jgi:lysozyme family protein